MGKSYDIVEMRDVPHGQGAFLVRALKQAGIRAGQYSSPYVGNTTIWVEKGQKTKANRIFREFGY